MYDKIEYWGNRKDPNSELSKKTSDLQILWTKNFINEDDNIMPGTAGSVAWSVDGRYLFFVLRDTSLDEAIWELCRIPAEGGEIEKLGFAGSRQMANLSVHPDGRRIAFSSVSTPLSPAVWVLENFLPSD